MEFIILKLGFTQIKPRIYQETKRVTARNLSEVSIELNKLMAGFPPLEDKTEAKVLELLDDGITVNLTDHNLCIIPVNY